jgi:uncharacterized membrane protein HdeD (DUF308 family)
MLARLWTLVGLIMLLVGNYWLFAEGHATPILLLTMGIFALIVGHLPAVRPQKKEHL